MIVDHIWKLQSRNRIYTDTSKDLSLLLFRELFVHHEATRNLEQNIEAVCVAADAINLIVSNAEVSRFAAGLSRGKSKIHTIHIHSHATCIHIHLTSIPSRATYTWTLSLSCSTCMSLVSRCWPGCFEKPVAAGFVFFRRNRAVLCRQSWQSNF